MAAEQGIYGGVLCVLILLVASAASAEVQVDMATPLLKLAIDDNTLAEYRFTDVPYKPYIAVIRTPSGINVLRDAPHDHLHHHALMFAIGVDDVDFWQEARDPGRQIHREFVQTGDLTPRYETAGFVERIDWLPTKSETLLLQETRTVHVFDPEEFGASILSWETVLTVPEEKDAVTLKGSHYFGLGMRFIQSMDKDGTYFNPDNAEGELVRGDERLTRSRWCAYHAMADGKPVTAAMFDSPNNPRHPAWWFTMHTPFAYLSATLNLYRQPMQLKSGESLALRYGVAFWDGHVDTEAVERTYKKWLKTQNKD
jgi:hypothetical protein